MWVEEVSSSRRLGTGSKPKPPQGWQREMRLKAIHVPFRMPHSSMASIAYCEQVGRKRHLLGPSKGERKSRYRRMGRTKS